MFSIANILSVTLTLFLVIDILGSVPVIISIKRNTGAIKPIAIVGFSGTLMIAFTLIGESLLHVLGIQVKSFAIAGAVVLLLLSLDSSFGCANVCLHFFQKKKARGLAKKCVAAEEKR